jgi:chromosome segregation ATPase
VNDPRHPADHALDQLKDAFWELDSTQRQVRAHVEAYLLYLPDRAARSSLRPTWQALDERADALVVDYLALLDRFPEDERQRGRDLSQRHRASAELEPRLRACSGDLRQFLASYDGELALVARQVAKAEEQRQRASAALDRAHREWERLRADGYTFAATDRMLAEARVAGRGVDSWDPGRGLDALAGLAGIVVSRADELDRLAAEGRERVAKAPRRVPALRTRVDALRHRSEQLPEHLGGLRREFSTRNWQDLDDVERRVAAAIATASATIDRLEAAVADRRWDDVVEALEAAGTQLSEADDLVDAARDRLEELRAFKRDPDERLRKARFALRDAQVLVVDGKVRDAADLARELDRLSARLDATAPTLEGVHPDYWSVMREVAAIEAGVKAVVQTYRSRVT